LKKYVDFIFNLFAKNLSLSDNEKEEILKSTLQQVEASNTKSLSNGMLMRVSPLAIAFHELDESV
jgi:ADP-ribosylglycohydrolase